MRHLLIALFTAAMLSGCTPPLTETELASVTKQNDAVSQALAASSKVQTKLIAEAHDSRRRCTFLRGGNVSLLPADPQRKPSSTALAMAKFASGLGAYTKSLNEAVNGGNVANLLKAAEAFKAEVKDTGVALDAKEVDPAIEALVNIGLRMSEEQRQRAIRGIMEDALVALLIVEDDIVRDAPAVVQENRALIGEWERATTCVLRELRRDGRSAVEALDEFTSERRSIEVQTKIVEKAPRLLEALMEAHVFAATEDPDLQLFIDQFSASYADLEALVDALEDETNGNG